MAEYTVHWGHHLTLCGIWCDVATQSAQTLVWPLSKYVAVMCTSKIVHMIVPHYQAWHQTLSYMIHTSDDPQPRKWPETACFKKLCIIKGEDYLTGRHLKQAKSSHAVLFCVARRTLVRTRPLGSCCDWKSSCGCQLSSKRKLLWFKEGSTNDLANINCTACWKRTEMCILVWHDPHETQQKTGCNHDLCKVEMVYGNHELCCLPRS